MEHGGGTTRWLHVRRKCLLMERDGYWAARSLDFGHTVYGKTGEETREALTAAFEALLASFRNDAGKVDEDNLTQWLDLMGVEYTLTNSPQHEEEIFVSPSRHKVLV